MEVYIFDIHGEGEKIAFGRSKAFRMLLFAANELANQNPELTYVNCVLS